MKNIVDFINEAQHWWANDRMNAKELKAFEKEENKIKKLSLGLQIIAKNHKCKYGEYAGYLKEDSSEMLFKLMGPKALSVPTQSDVDMLVKDLELEDYVDIYDFSDDLSVTYYCQDEEEGKYCLDNFDNSTPDID